MIGEYFDKKFNVDFRCLRYPGVISSEKFSFNGTACYSTQIFFEMIEKGHYDCFLKENEAMPMIYIDDCVNATVQFLKADPNKLSRNSYNLAGISLTPKELEVSIKKLLPHATVSYKPDFR